MGNSYSASNTTPTPSGANQAARAKREADRVNGNVVSNAYTVMTSASPQAPPAREAQLTVVDEETGATVPVYNANFNRNGRSVYTGDAGYPFSARASNSGMTNSGFHLRQVNQCEAVEVENMQLRRQLAALRSIING